MEIRKVNVAYLKEADYNPRQISDEELKRLEDSMEKFGYVEPIVWNETAEISQLLDQIPNKYEKWEKHLKK